MAYIDTCVLVAYYCPEPLSKAAQPDVGPPNNPLHLRSLCGLASVHHIQRHLCLCNCVLVAAFEQS